MKLGYLILYVESVAAAVTFYEAAFGLSKKFIHGLGQYAELDTGTTTLAFAEHGLAAQNLPEGFIPLGSLKDPVGLELGFVTDDVPAAVAKAVAAGAVVLSEPKLKPWGQTVAFLRGPHGELLELCTAVGE